MHVTDLDSVTSVEPMLCYLAVTAGLGCSEVLWRQQQLCCQSCACNICCSTVAQQCSQSQSYGCTHHHRLVGVTLKRLLQGQVPAEAPTESQYGSPEADAAVQKLQSMGATVYPPGNKDAIDWGVLAGEVQPGPGTAPCTAVRHLLLALKDIAALPGGAGFTTAWQGHSSRWVCGVGTQCGGASQPGLCRVLRRAQKNVKQSQKATMLQRRCLCMLPAAGLAAGSRCTLLACANNCSGPAHAPCHYVLHPWQCCPPSLLGKMVCLACITLVLQAMTTRSVRLRTPCCWRCSTLKSMMTLPNAPAKATPATSPGL